MRPYALPRYGYTLMTIAFLGSVIFLGRRHSRMSDPRFRRMARDIAVGIFTLGVIVALASGQLGVDTMLEHGGSSVLVASMWRIATEQCLFGFPAAVLLWISPRVANLPDG